MQHHPTVSQLTLFCARALALSELTAMAEHLTVCLDCQRDLREIFQQHRDNQPIAFSLAEAEWFRDAHLDYEQLSALADGELGKADAAIIAAHLETCLHCAASADNFLAHRRKLESELNARYAPDENPKTAELAAGMGMTRYLNSQS